MKFVDYIILRDTHPGYNVEAEQRIFDDGNVPFQFQRIVAFPHHVALISGNPFCFDDQFTSLVIRLNRHIFAFTNVIDCVFL